MRIGAITRATAISMLMTLLTAGISSSADISDTARARLLMTNAVTIEIGDDGVSGWGFIAGKGAEGELYIVTANHVVRHADSNNPDGPVSLPKGQIDVGLYNGDTVEATLLEAYVDRPEDLAVLRIPAQPALQWSVVGLGHLAEDTVGDSVSTVGAAGAEWIVPLQGGKLNNPCARDCLALFEGLAVTDGMSGGPLVAADGIVAMLLSQKTTSNPRGLPIDGIRQRFEDWNIPWSLVSPVTYGTMVGGFFEAAKAGDLAEVKRLADLGVELSTLDSDGLTALLFAVRIGDLSLAEYLHQAGVHDSHALASAANGDFVDIGRLLIDSSTAEERCAALKQSTIMGSLRYADLLFAAEPRLASHCDGHGLLYIAANNGRSEIGLALLKSGARPVNDEPLGLALARRATPLAAALLPLTPNVLAEPRTDTALHTAAGMGDVETVRELLARGWDKDAMSYNGTPLAVAVANGQHEAASLLLMAKANAQLYGSGPTPIALAIRAKDLELIRLLLTVGNECVFLGTYAEAATNGSQQVYDFIEKLVQDGAAHKC